MIVLRILLFFAIGYFASAFFIYLVSGFNVFSAFKSFKKDKTSKRNRELFECDLDRLAEKIKNRE